LVEDYFGEGGELSSVAVLNIVTAGYDILIKLAEAYDERHDVHHTGAFLTEYRGHNDWVISLAKVGEHGESFLTGSSDCTVRLWDTLTGACQRIFHGHTGWVYAVADVDGTTFVSGSEDRTAIVWNATSGEKIHCLLGHKSAITCIETISGNFILTGSKDHTIRRWDTLTGNCADVLFGHANAILCIADLSQRYFISGSADETIKVWDKITWNFIHSFADPTGSVTALSGIDDSSFLSGSSGGCIKHWDLNSKSCIRSYAAGGHVTCVANVDGKTFLSAGYTCKLWITKTGQCIRSFAGNEMNIIKSMVLLNRKRFVTGSNDNNARRWAISMMNLTETKYLNSSKSVSLLEVHDEGPCANCASSPFPECGQLSP